MNNQIFLYKILNNVVLESLMDIDQSLFLTLNRLHNHFFDRFFSYATQPFIWIPLYLLLLVLVIRSFRWKTFVVIIAVALMIGVSDQLANVSKSTVKRIRPTYHPDTEQMVHTVNGYKGGQYGFYSSHASTNFAIAIFLILLLRKRTYWITPLLLIWASIMAYSRIYLGVHYPGDILAGIIIGVLLGFLFAWLTRKIIFPHSSGTSPSGKVE